MTTETVDHELEANGTTIRLSWVVVLSFIIGVFMLIFGTVTVYEFAQLEKKADKDMIMVEHKALRDTLVRLENGQDEMKRLLMDRILPPKPSVR